MIKRPYCGYEGVKEVKGSWRFRFYTVARLKCLKCHNIFNHYYGVSPRGKISEFNIRVKPRK